MIRMLVAIILALVLAHEAHAQTKVCRPGHPDECAQPLQKGDVAPFEGQLLTPRLAIKQATKAHTCDQSTELAVGEVRETLQAKIDAEQQHRAIDARTSTMREELLKKRLLEAQNAAVRRWWEDPRLWFVAGLVGGAAGTVAAVFSGVQIVKSSQ